jgi:hypothetical protein
MPCVCFVFFLKGLENLFELAVCMQLLHLHSFQPLDYPMQIPQGFAYGYKLLQDLEAEFEPQRSTLNQDSNPISTLFPLYFNFISTSLPK